MSDSSFEFEYRGEIPMKGKPRPIKMWLLSRKKRDEDVLLLKNNLEINLNEIKCPFSNIINKN